VYFLFPASYIKKIFNCVNHPSKIRWFTGIYPEKMVTYYDKLTGIMGVDLLRKDEDGNFRSLPQIDTG
jgi:hypothetical protein